QGGSRTGVGRLWRTGGWRQLGEPGGLEDRRRVGGRRARGGVRGLAGCSGRGAGKVRRRGVGGGGLGEEYGGWRGAADGGLERLGGGG
ncbi:hypothetical protein QE152_g41615, partial [Popillia japonica]